MGEMKSGEPFEEGEEWVDSGLSFSSGLFS